MVKKLIKHEFIYYARTLSIFLPLVLVIGVMARVIQFFESESFIYAFVSGSSLFMLYVAVMACMILTTVLSIVRVYKNMYTSEGYLSFTLPVTNAQHIFVKVLVSVVCSFVSLLTVIVSAMIAFSGVTMKEILNVFKYLIVHELFEKIDSIHLVFFIIEFAIMVLISAISAPLMYYTCITIGQTARKNRILSAVGVYFIYYMATQVISTVFTVVWMIAVEMGALDGLLKFAEAHPYTVAHTAFIVSIVVNAAIATALYFVTLRIMNRKLNLE